MSDNNYLIGIDIGGTTVKLGLYSDEADPTLLKKKVIPTKTEDSGAEILSDTAKALRQLAEEADIALPQVSGIGIGVPGPVLTDADGNQFVNKCVNLGWETTVNVSDIFNALSGIDRISVLNDANAAALGELHASKASSSADSAVMVTLGTGVGGGVIVDGKIVTGAFGSGGEIGHMPVSPTHSLLQVLISKDAELKSSADLEYYVSATGISRIANAVLSVTDTETTLRSLDASPIAKDVFDAAKSGDACAIEICDFFFDTLGTALASVASVTDPDMFIIGGGVSHAGEYLLKGLQEAYRNKVFHASIDTRFKLAELGNDAGLIGAVVPLIGS